MPDKWGSPGGSFSWEGISLLPSVHSSILSDVFPTCCFLLVTGMSLFSACQWVWMERWVACTSQHGERGQFSRANPLKRCEFVCFAGRIKWIIYSSDVISPWEFRWMDIKHVTQLSFWTHFSFWNMLSHASRLISEAFKHPKLTGVF